MINFLSSLRNVRSVIFPMKYSGIYSTNLSTLSGFQYIYVSSVDDANYFLIYFC